MNRKAMGTKELLGVILAVVIIVLFFIGGQKAYGVIFGDPEEGNAKTLRDNLEGKINNLKAGQSNTYPMGGVEGYVVVGYTYPNERPGKCFFNSCICVCRAEEIIDKPSVDSCQEGFCAKFDKDVAISVSTPSRTRTIKSVRNEMGIPDRTERDICWGMPNKLMDVEIIKDINYVEVNLGYSCNELLGDGEEGDD